MTELRGLTEAEGLGELVVLEEFLKMSKDAACISISILFTFLQPFSI